MTKLWKRVEACGRDFRICTNCISRDRGRSGELGVFFSESFCVFGLRLKGEI